LQNISPNAAVIAAVVPLPAHFATLDGPVIEMSSLQKAVARLGIRIAGRQIIKARGALFPDLNHRFRVEYRINSEDDSKKRCEARDDAAARKLQADIDAGLSWAQKAAQIEQLAAEKAARDAARFDAIYKKILASIGKDKSDKLYTEAEAKFFLRHEDREKRAQTLAEALPSDLIARYRQSSEDRIMGSGYQWAGGYIGKYFQMPFVSKGLASEAHWLLQRFIAACPRASSGDFKVGRGKDSCISVRRKIVGFDEPYVFFGQRCKELFRVDLDQTFADEAELNAWLDDLMARGVLKFRPHVASWIFDDKRGGIIHPHLWFVLPEGSAVWGKRAPVPAPVPSPSPVSTAAPVPVPAHIARQHRMLSQVIASLTLALGGDPGGLSSPFHGKNPVSVHCNYAILNDESFPTLSDYAKGMKLTHDAMRMAREIMNDRLAEVGFDPQESNTYFNLISKAANEAAKALYKGGFRIGEIAEFEEAVYDVAYAVMKNELPRANAKQQATAEKLVETCSRWAVQNFDVTMMEKRCARGAAAHLIKPDMDKKAKQAAGGTYASKAKGEINRAAVSVAIRAALQAGGAEPTFRQIADATGFALNTVKKHWMPAYTQAQASLSIHSLVKGVNTTTTTYRPARPTLETLRTARSMDEIPVAWRDLALTDHFRDKQLRAQRSKRRNGRQSAPVHVRNMPGRPTLDFLLAGGVTVYRRKPVDNQPAQS
jgi:hypothetical protein